MWFWGEQGGQGEQRESLGLGGKAPPLRPTKRRRQPHTSAIEASDKDIVNNLNTNNSKISRITTMSYDITRALRVSIVKLNDGQNLQEWKDAVKTVFRVLYYIV